MRAGKRLASEGAFAHEFFVIDTGEAVVTKGDETLPTLGPGDFFGEIALVETDRRTASVTAQTDMTVLVMHQSGFASMMVAVAGDRGAPAGGDPQPPAADG